jgi:hypothetical protein
LHLDDADGKDDGRDPPELEDPLDAVSRLVVKEPGKQVLFLEDELAHEKDRPVVLPLDLFAAFLDGREGVDLDGMNGLRVEAEVVGQADVFLKLPVDMALQVLDFFGPLEVLPVDTPIEEDNSDGFGKMRWMLGKSGSQPP